MPLCPRCHDEYRADVTVCATCGVALVSDDTPLPPRVDALLGTFHPLAATPVVQLLERRGVEYDALHSDDARVEVVVDREWRDDLRAELAMSWSGLLQHLEPEQRREVLAAGGRQPGWFDAPQGAWVDRQGRLQVDPTPAEEAEADAQRIIGPSLAALGALLLLFGWWTGGSELAVVVGIAAVIIGVLLPR